MRKRIKDTLRESVQDIVDAGISPKPFTNDQLKELGVKIPVIKMTPAKIQRIRKSTNLSQSLFAQLLNVSPASVRHWEQGLRAPTGSTKVLLDLLKRDPHTLDHMLPRSLRAA
jgi:putative transcriptional regulator